ncbi:L-rhamnose mutarotase [Compostibacter hankyongensis]|uniref:L-rhamnose mutarotase n=1 Tax=Compostibacter hankyongensis TaxID=1007089 RepID=A0ABP8FQE6_9BACT
MTRIAFTMKLNPGCRDEYIRRHDALWPELKALLKRKGIGNYSIFLDEERNILFGIQELQEGAETGNIGDEPVMKKWWAHMADIMETNPDNSPASVSLTEVFHMD